jgi:hypothetical protein
MTIDDVRAALSKRTEDCNGYPLPHPDGCPGWAVMYSNRDIEIQRCDECCRALERDHGIELTDDDVAQLPEAIKALNAEFGVEDSDGD